MMAIIYKDGTEQVTERCFHVLDRSGDGQPRRRWVTRLGRRLQWIEPRELKRVNVEM